MKTRLYFDEHGYCLPKVHNISHRSFYIVCTLPYDEFIVEGTPVEEFFTSPVFKVEEAKHL